MKAYLRALLFIAVSTLATQALAGEPYICRLNSFNSNTKTYDHQQTKVIWNSFDALLETDAGDVQMKIWRTSSRDLGTGIVISKKIHVKFSANGKETVERSAREGDLLQSTLKDQWRVACSPMFSAFPGRVSPGLQKYHDENRN